LAQAALKLSTRMRPIDEPAFNRDVDRLVQRYLIYADENARFSTMMRETLSIMYKHGLRMNHDLTIGVKAMMQAEEIVSTLGPDLGMVETAFDAAQGLLVEQINPETVSNLLKDQVNRTARELVKELPALQEATMRWVLQYKRGRFDVSINVESDDLMRQAERLNLGLERVTVSLLLAGLLLGSGIAATVPHPEIWVGWPIAALVIFIISGGLTALMVWRMLRDLWSHNDR
ncbi:MAG: hypothetical protein KC547_07235, partial [Anaerolineae bacterium]|nr:hypothetical protein [Anaerolineae bacterium]